MIYLREITLKKPLSGDQFPCCLPIIQNLSKIEFTSPVTFFVGENGSGKSTLIEAIAAGFGSISVGSDSIDSDPTLAHARSLARSLKFVRNQIPKRGFFFRAEDFFGFTKRIIHEQGELSDLEDSYDNSLSGYGRMLATGMARGQRLAMENRYGSDPDAFSHGENLLNLIQTRMVPNGFYLLDEPESPLSPLRQIALISIIKEKVDLGCQFIIATHSPILMAFPGATILSFENGVIAPVEYADIEHVSLTRDFLNNPESFLRHL